MKVGEQALYLARLKGMTRHDALSKLKYWFELFEIRDWWNKKVEELSKGMQQKIQFIITVLHEPKLLIFDEPFTGFDPINTNLIKNTIIDIKNKGATIIFSTHNMESVEELCDHIVLINNSKKILDGSMTDLRKTYKSNTYEITFTGKMTDFTNVLSNGYELIEQHQDSEICMAKVNIVNEGSSNELLQKILPTIQILSFNEVIPSMRDVFIQVVNGEKAS